jgi:hypothetical protein
MTTFNHIKGTVRRDLTEVESGTSRSISFQDIPLDLIFIQSTAVKEHKTVKRYIIQISSHLLVIFKHWSKFVVAAHESI